MSAQSDELRPCFRCGTRAPLNADKLCITCGEPDDAEQAFDWTCSRCGSQHPSTVTGCPCVYEDSF